MTINEGGWDRAFRIFLAFAFGYAAWISWPGAMGVVFVILAAVAVATGLVGWCPAYTVFGLSTTRKKIGA